MDQTASYCTALIAQERGLEELQRHLRTTEDLFRESVKRKNQQLAAFSPMDPLAALLRERPPQQLSASELRSRIALHEDAARAYRAELESRTARLDALPDEIQQVIFGQLCNALDPRSAVAYSSASKRLRELIDAAGW